MVVGKSVARIIITNIVAAIRHTLGLVEHREVAMIEERSSLKLCLLFECDCRQVPSMVFL